MVGAPMSHDAPLEKAGPTPGASVDGWRWAGPDGQQRRARLDQLRAALAEGQLAPNTPVWRPGWREWKPAHDVAELTSAAVGNANGVMLNVPPPPLAVIAVQEQYEAASASIIPPPVAGRTEEEPPPPPAYVPAPTKPPATPRGGFVSAPPPKSDPSPKLGASLPTAIGLAPMPKSDPSPKLGPSLPTAIGLAPSPGLLALAGVKPAEPTAGVAPTGDLPPPTAPVVHEPVPSVPDLALPMRRSPIALLMADIEALRAGRPPENKPILIVASVLGISVLMLLGAGIVTLARSGSSSSSKAAPSASVAASAPKPPASAAPVVAPPPPEAKAAAEPKRDAPAIECELAGDAKTVAPRAVIASAVEAAAGGGVLAFGFAAAPRDAVAVSVDPTTLAPTATVHAKPVGGDARRVTPMPSAGKVTALADADRKGDKLGGRRVTIATGTAIDLGVADGAIVWASHGKDAGTKLFSLDGDGPVEALRATSLGDAKGLALAFRRGNAIYVGAAKGDALEPAGGLAKIAGLGQVGSPTIAVSGEQIFVAWADRAGPDDEWRVRWAKLKIGDAAADGETFTPPAGGPGGAAMSPSLAALGGGRALLAWTEGPVASHQVRAITLDADGKPTGAALAISSAGVNAGQPAAAVGADGRGAVAYIALKGKATTVQATPVRCAAR